MSRVATVALVLGLGVAAVRAGGAQQDFLPRTPNVTRDGTQVDRAVRWVADVMRHAPGVRDAAVEEVARWATLP